MYPVDGFDNSISIESICVLGEQQNWNDVLSSLCGVLYGIVIYCTQLDWCKVI